MTTTKLMRACKEFVRTLEGVKTRVHSEIGVRLSDSQAQTVISKSWQGKDVMIEKKGRKIIIRSV